jgi:hypothetical protein
VDRAARRHDATNRCQYGGEMAGQDGRTALQTMGCCGASP